MDPQQRLKINAFFRQSLLIQEPLTRVIAELARDVVWDNAIKPKDAIHIATAAYHRIPVMHTYDEGLTGLGTITVHGFTFSIIEPHATVQLQLPHEEPQTPPDRG